MNRLYIVVIACVLVLLICPLSGPAEEPTNPTGPENAGDKPAPDKKDEAAGGAKDVFLRALDGMKTQSSYRFEMNTAFQAGSVPVKLQVSGFFKAPDFFHLKAEGLGGTAPVEGYYKGDKGAVKDDFRRKWVPSEQATMPIARFRMRRPDEILDKLQPYAETGSLGNPEKVGEVDCDTISFALPAEALSPLLKAFGVPMGSAKFDPTRTTVSARCYVGKATNLPHKLLILLETQFGEPEIEGEGEPGLEDETPEEGGEPDVDVDDEEVEPPSVINLTITISAEFLDYGKEPVIEMPPEVKELLGMTEEPAPEEKKPEEK
ncbi:MAG: hypothetical protein RDV41_03325 [Planctomycetota bacterium]|nr:hypothetical protein [Planctomycetota bacterium]